MVISYNIKQYRQAAGLSQQQLAGISGVSQTTINRLEQQGGNVSLLLICKIANALNVSAYKLFDIKS